MDNRQTTWTELSDRLEALGLKLKLHLEQATDGELSGALATLRQKVEDAFEATGRAVKDEAVRTDVREVGRLVADAVATGLNRVGDDVREKFRGRP
ncbi:MAG TPA: hypothetical protein VF462_09925 [Micromonosporaceae bacterium]